MGNSRLSIDSLAALLRQGTKPQDVIAFYGQRELQSLVDGEEIRSKNKMTELKKQLEDVEVQRGVYLEDLSRENNSAVAHLVQLLTDSEEKISNDIKKIKAHLEEIKYVGGRLEEPYWEWRFAQEELRLVARLIEQEKKSEVKPSAPTRVIVSGSVSLPVNLSSARSTTTTPTPTPSVSSSTSVSSATVVPSFTSVFSAPSTSNENGERKEQTTSFTR